MYRYLAFCHPDFAEDFCNRRKIIIYIICINIFCLITVIPHIFAMTWEPSSNGFKIVLTDFGCSKSFQQGYLIGVIFYRWIVPSLILVSTNFKVYRKVNSVFNLLIKIVLLNSKDFSRCLYWKWINCKCLNLDKGTNTKNWSKDWVIKD